MQFNEKPNIDMPRSFDEVIASYIEATECGLANSRETWLANHPDDADKLKAYFDAEDDVGRITHQLRRLPKPRIETAFGNHLLLDEIGRGGMGVVYRAKHLKLDRVVALKLVRSSRAFSANDSLRFRNEAEATSRLDHPNIVPIYDFGEHDGEFYFTMKLIEGSSLADWHHGLPRSEWCSRFNQLRIARVVSEIARAVHHAHQRGILHRDLKPSNILLDHNEHPFVADFGLAKQIESDEELTMTGAIVGTPSYMAPEQSLSLKSGRQSGNENHLTAVTIAADVYGLGAVLYFLLTGRPPFKGATPLETLLLVRDKEVSAPSSIEPSIDKDLDAICQKCLQKEPNQRYESAEALASDLTRWIGGHPTLARPPRIFERGLRWCRRNRLLTGMLSAIVLSTIFGIASLVVGIITANQARNDAIQQRKTALTNLRTVITEINDLENRRPDLDELRLELLSRIQKQLEPMLNDSAQGTLADETSFWLEIDAGDVEEFRGNAKAARQHFDRALSISNRLNEQFPSNHARLHTFALSHIGDADMMIGHATTAREFFESAMRIRESIDAASSSIQTRADLALSQFKLASCLIVLGRESKQPDLFDVAEEYARKSLLLYEQLTVEQPKDVWHARFLATARQNIADALLHQHRYENCLAECRLGLKDLADSIVRMPDYQLILDVHSAWILDVMSQSCLECGLFEDGIRAATDGLNLRKRLAQASPQAVNLRFGMIGSLMRLGQNLHGMAKISEALQAYDEALAIGEELNLRDFRDFITLDLSIEAMMPDSNYDARTLQFLERRLALRKLDYDAEIADGVKYFESMMELAEFYALIGNEHELSQTLQSAQHLVDASKALNARADIEVNLRAHRQLFDLVGQGGSDCANALVEITTSQSMASRLQSIFRSQGDAGRLAMASTKLSDLHHNYRQTDAAIRGLAQAAKMEQDDNRQKEHLKMMDLLLARLRKFGKHVDSRIGKLDFEQQDDSKMTTTKP